MEEWISDPTEFRTVLTDNGWHHIMERHPVMRPFKALVLQAVQNPDGIYRGKRDPDRRIYRKRHLEVPGAGESLDLLVFADSTNGYIVTAYFAAYSVRMLGTQIWPTS